MAKRIIHNVILINALCLSALTAAVPPAIDDLFAAYNKPGVPGAAVAVIHQSKIVHAKGYGLADVENGVKVTADTNFRLASVTKAFTAMAILRLIDAGKLRFTDALTDLFPEFPAYGKTITVRHLLHHTGGLKDYENFVSGPKQISDNDVLKMMMKQTSGDFTPGSRYRYSNGGYCVLGQIVEVVSAKSFAAFLRDAILDPLGMVNSVAFEQGLSTVSNRAYGYSPAGASFEKTDQSNTSATLGDGGLYSSVQEFFLWDQALYGSTLLPTALMEEIFTPGTLNDGSKTAYGYGWMLDTYRGLKRQHHTGSTIGFRTSIIRIPSRDFTVVILINRANSTPWSIGDQIVDRFLF